MHKYLKYLTDDAKEKLKKKKMPKWTNPMLAKLTHDYFSDKNWIYERKLDGERILVFCNNKSIKLMTRNKKQAGETYPEAVKAFSKYNKTNFDVARNAYAQTAVASYAVRAKSGAPVAAPIGWDELNSSMSPQKYNIKNIFRRLSQKEDPWKDWRKHSVTINKEAKKIEEILKKENKKKEGNKNG